MAPLSIHPFHQIRYLRLDVNLPTRRDSPTKLSLADAKTVPLSTPGVPTLSSEGAAGTESRPLTFDRRASSPFSELSALSQQRQLSPIYPLPTPLPRVPKDCEAFWKLKEALDRLNAPIPRQPNTVAVRDSGDPKPSDPLNRSKRRADPPTPGPKRVKLSPSVTGSSDFAHSTPGSYNLPLCGLVVFVDSRIDGCSTSEHWGGILRDLGARVVKTFSRSCTHVVFYGGRRATAETYKRTSDQYKPMVVGLGWVEQCRKENSHVKEKDYLVDLASIPETSFGRQRKNLPKSLSVSSYDGSFELADSSLGSPSIGGESISH